VFDYTVKLEKEGEQTTATLDTDLPNVHVEIVTDTGERWVGTFVGGNNIPLPAGAMSMSVSTTASAATGELDLWAPSPPHTQPIDFSQGLAGKTQRKDPILVYLFPVDSFDPKGDWDTQGAFTVLAADQYSAHKAVQTWAAGHGLDSVPEIVEVNSAWTRHFVDNLGTYEFHVTCLNDQKSQISGAFNYENGTQVALHWPTMQKRNTPLWMSTSVMDLGMFPANSASILESFRIDVQAQNPVDGLVMGQFEVQVQGTPVP